MIEPTYPTDRRYTTPLLGPGVDTVAVTGWVDSQFVDSLPYRLLHGAWDEQTGEWTTHKTGANGWLQTGLAEASVRVFRADTQPRVKVEVSAARVLYGHNAEPLPVELLVDVVSIIADELGLQGRGYTGGLRLSRLDLTMDFAEVADPTGTLAALARRPDGWATSFQQYLRRSGKVQTVTWGSPTQWTVRLYDKSYEIQHRKRSNNGLSPLDRAWAQEKRGQLRFEAQLRRPLLNRLRMTDPSLITQELITKTARHYFDLCGLGNPRRGLRGVSDAVEELYANGRVRAAAGLLAYLASQQVGVGAPMGSTTERKYRALARTLGLTGSDLSETARPEPALDFDEQRQRVPVGGAAQ